MKKTDTANPLPTQLQMRLLELLSKGHTSQRIADETGYQAGTIRVYLHKLYRELDVLNRTQAVTWWLDFTGQTVPMPSASAESSAVRHVGFGERAVIEGLYKPLGMLEMYLGPYSRAWELANALDGGSPSEGSEEGGAYQYASIIRPLWVAFLSGDFDSAKRLFDKGYLQKIYLVSPTDASLLTTMLIVGGYTSRANRALNSLSVAKKGGLLAVERQMLVALLTAAESAKPIAFAQLHDQLSASGASSKLTMVFRHLLLVSLFHLYRGYSDIARATAIADFLYQDIEKQRQQLSTFGDQPPPQALPAAPKIIVRPATAKANKLAQTANA